MAHTHKQVNGMRVALTAAEIAALDARDAAWVPPTSRTTAVAQSDLTSEQKLARLGLTVAELRELLK
jgi:hypothetical protein